MTGNGRGDKIHQIGQQDDLPFADLRIQIWTALIAILLLKWLHHLSKAKWSLSNLASMLWLNLFTCRDLTAWLDNPFGTPPLLLESQQLTLGLA